MSDLGTDAIGFHGCGFAQGLEFYSKKDTILFSYHALCSAADWLELALMLLKRGKRGVGTGKLWVCESLGFQFISPDLNNSSLINVSTALTAKVLIWG